MVCLLGFSSLSGQAVANNQETPETLGLTHPGQHLPHGIATEVGWDSAFPAKVGVCAAAMAPSWGLACLRCRAQSQTDTHSKSHTVPRPWNKKTWRHPLSSEGAETSAGSQVLGWESVNSAMACPKFIFLLSALFMGTQT